MPDNVVRSGVAHTVVTSDITKNAVNPRNSFIETDKTSLHDISDEFAQPDADPPHATPQAVKQPIIEDRYDTNESLSIAKSQITKNLQKLTPEKPTNNDLFLEALHKLEDRIQHFRTEHSTQNNQRIDRHDITDNMQSLGKVDHLKDNIQSLGKKSYTDNRQLVNEKIVGNNFQSIGSTESTHDRVLFKEKKNIQENYQHINETSTVRTSTHLSSSAPEGNLSPLNLAAVKLEDMSIDDVNVLLDQAMNSFNEDELRAKIRKMKEKLASANRTLKDIEAQDAKDSPQEP